MTRIIRLLNQIKHKELVLPEFQREFTWNKDQSKKLIESFLKDYPTGALLFWKTNEEIALKNMPNFDYDGRIEVILDGQQRLTTLYMLLMNNIPPYYKERDMNIDIRNLYYNLETMELEYYIKNKMQNNPRWVKITEIFNGDDVNVWKIAQKLKEKEGINIESVFEDLHENYKKMQSIKEEDYKIIYVDDSSSLQEALTVFDRINSQGTPLSQADIALAHMCSRWSKTRRTFKRKINELKNQGFEFDLTFFVRAMNAVINHRADYEQLHENVEKELMEGFNKLDTILDYLINILKDRAYIYSTDDLNTTNVLIPIIGYLSLYGPEFPDEKSLKKFLYWMYAALYQRRYTSSVDQKLEEDLQVIKEEYTPEVHPIDDLLEVLKEENGDPVVTKSNFTSKRVGHPLYNMTNIVIRANRGVDWSTGIKLSQPFGEKYRVERHHIFPKSVLEEAGYDTGHLHHRRLVHEIANRVPLTRRANMDIFNQKPEKYFPKIEEKYPGNLEKFFIPMNKELWKVENYEQFLDKRRELIANGINTFMESLIHEDSDKLEDKHIYELIKKNESENLEFKSSIRWNLYTEDYDKNLEKPILKTINAFLNTNGGTLLIGVKDDGTVFGIEKDVTRFGDLDKYELHLSHLISEKVGKTFMPYIHISFPEYNDTRICRIDVERGPKESYLQIDNDEKFYIRLSNNSTELKPSEIEDYKSNNWN